MIMLFKQRSPAICRMGLCVYFGEGRAKYVLVGFRSLSCFCKTTSYWTLGSSYSSSVFWQLIMRELCLTFDHTSLPILLLFPFFFILSGSKFLNKVLWPALLLPDFLLISRFEDSGFPMFWSWPLVRNTYYTVTQNTFVILNFYYLWCTQSGIV